jgi:hypothetical protein
LGCGGRLKLPDTVEAQVGSALPLAGSSPTAALLDGQVVLIALAALVGTCHNAEEPALPIWLAPAVPHNPGGKHQHQTMRKKCYPPHVLI